MHRLGMGCNKQRPRRGVSSLAVLLLYCCSAMEISCLLVMEDVKR